MFNILLWAAACAPLLGASDLLTYQVVLSGIYVAVCAFRSWLPRIDLERYVLVDSWLSSAFVGRMAATVAEVSFAAQVALSLYQIGDAAGLAWVQSVAYVVVPLLALAQVFCWYSVLTLNHLGHAIEQSLWTSTMAAVGVCLLVSAGHLSGELQLFVWAGTVLAFGFVTFMTLVDVPMYIARWREGRLQRRTPLTLTEGLHDALHRRIETRDWSRWRPEVAWLTGYFSVAVWLSVALVRFSA